MLTVKHIAGLFALMSILISCQSQEYDRDENVLEVNELGQLSTTEYTVGKIIKLDNSEAEWYKWGDRKILISCKAVIKAGVDLSKIEEKNIKVKGNTIEITLPPAEITTFKMDPKFVQTEMESVSGFRDNFTQAEKNDFLKQGEEAIRQEIKNLPILSDAEENAESMVRELYESMGYEKVIIHKRKAE